MFFFNYLLDICYIEQDVCLFTDVLFIKATFLEGLRAKSSSRPEFSNQVLFKLH
ncbi:MAG: hypothetical protein QG594_1956 [Bacteroidota bacterium]|nr:hypothetical protein [Bacteroidota bacterium]